MDSLHDNDVWDLVELPTGEKVVGSKWIFKVKTNADGSVERCKTHLVAQGYSQEKGLNYDETFSPIVRSESIASIHSCRVKTSFTATGSSTAVRLHGKPYRSGFLFSR